MGKTLSRMMGQNLYNFARELLEEIQTETVGEAIERPVAVFEGMCVWPRRRDLSFFSALLIDGLRTVNHPNALDRLGRALLRMHSHYGIDPDPVVLAITRRLETEKDDEVRASLARTMFRLNELRDEAE